MAYTRLVLRCMAASMAVRLIRAAAIPDKYIALFPPQVLLGSLEVEPALHGEVLVSGVASRVDVPLGQLGLEHRISAAFGPVG